MHKTSLPSLRRRVERFAPGLVSWLAGRRPPRAFPLPVATCGWARRLQLRGQLRHWKPGLGPSAPHSHLFPRRALSPAGNQSRIDYGERSRRCQAASGGIRAAVSIAVAAADVKLGGEVWIFAHEPDGEAPPPAA